MLLILNKRQFGDDTTMISLVIPLFFPQCKSRSYVLTSMKAPSAVKILVFGPLLHLPKQFTLTTGTEDGVRKVKVAIVASEPFSRHL